MARQTLEIKVNLGAVAGNLANHPGVRIAIGLAGSRQLGVGRKASTRDNQNSGIAAA